LDQEALVTYGFRGKSIYGCSTHKSLLSILFVSHMRFKYICMHSCRRNLNHGLFSIIEHNPLKIKLDRSGKHKIKLTSKSCRCFFYTNLAVPPKVGLNLGLLGKKLIILQLVIRIEGITTPLFVVLAPGVHGVQGRGGRHELMARLRASLP
jgi:hypothetical protein